MTLPSNPRAKKYWSQNFFTVPELLDEALEQLDLSNEDTVLEIGPGHAVLTDLLLKRVARVTALEIDPDLYQPLRLKYRLEPRLDLRRMDIMHYDLKDFEPEMPLARRKLIANIPYHLTSPILLKAINEPALREGRFEPFFSDICLMVQREVAEKLMAAPGTPAHGVLAITVAYAAEVSLLAELPREYFDPVPRVDSALVRLRPRTESPVSLDDVPLFWQLLTRCYTLRRKTLRNVLKSLGVTPDGITALGQQLDLGRRGETLSLQELADLANGIAQQRDLKTD